MFFYQFLGDQKPQPRPLISLGAEKGGEEIFLDVFAHTDTIVGNFKMDLVIHQQGGSHQDIYR